MCELLKPESVRDLPRSDRVDRPPNKLLFSLVLWGGVGIEQWCAPALGGFLAWHGCGSLVPKHTINHAPHRCFDRD